MRIKTKIKVYGAKVTILLGSFDEVKKYVPNALLYDGSINDDPDTYTGICCCRYTGSNKYPFSILIHCREQTLSVVAHECLHAANYILEGIGTEPSFANDEPQAYLMEYLVAQVEQALKSNS